MTAQQLLDGVDVVAVEEACGEPRALSELIADEARRRPLTVQAGVVFGTAPWADIADVRTSMPGRGAGATAQAVPLGYADMARAWREGTLRADAAAITVTGSGRLGVHVGYVPEVVAAVRAQGGRLLVERSAAMPDVAGAPEVDLGGAHVVDTERPPVEAVSRPPSATDLAIATNIASLVGSGSCIEVGIGAIGDAVFGALVAAGRRDLSVHSGMLGGGTAAFLAGDVLAPATPLGDPPVTGSLLVGGADLFALAARDERVNLKPSAQVHAVAVGSSIERFTAINFALEVDLAGNVNGEAVGGRVISGPGGQLDFATAACAAPGGRSIIALPSRGVVDRLSGPTSTPASRVHFVVTEHGIAELWGRSTDERAQALRAIAP